MFPSQMAVLALASAMALPLGAQQTQSTAGAQDNSSSTSQQQSSQTAQPLNNGSKEGFWGRVNPWARKKWVKRQTDPINDRLTELDEVTARNAKQIQDVDSRAQAGIKQAQSTADQANQTATAAGTQAHQANTVAHGAAGHVDQIHTTVSGIDQYKPINELDVPFRRGSTVLSEDAKKQLDDLAQSVKGHRGYIVEVEAHSPSRGTVGIQNSERLAESVKRYLVEHDVPVYRVHAVALGNAEVASNAGSTDEAKPAVKTSSVHIRLMENSLAARDAASPQGAASTNGAERP
jgi:outer membrane protein OmpA-like peptidoglycan-associated protein